MFLKRITISIIVGSITALGLTVYLDMNHILSLFIGNALAGFVVSTKYWKQE